MWSDSKPLTEDPAGNYIHYGVREFGMTDITNGISLHGGFLPYSATFLMFVEYACKCDMKSFKELLHPQSIAGTKPAVPSAVAY